ncbi:MAG: DUF2007 domain-containing protein [Candidatus Kapaibacterium sp.]
MKSKLATVAVVSTVFEADLLCSRLEGEGIRAFIANKNLVGMNWLYSNALGGVRVEVEYHNEQAAREIIALVQAQEFALDPSSDDWGCCPECGSNRIEFIQDKRSMAFSWLLAGFPLFFPREEYRCHQCFHVWKEWKE